MLEKINHFVKSQERNIQLDFFRSNGEVLFQVFKQYDTKRWDTKIELVDEKGLILQIIFNKGKTHNKENFERFSNSYLFNEFSFIEFHKQKAYFRGIPSSWNQQKVINLFNELINTVFALNSGFYFTLNAY